MMVVQVLRFKVALQARAFKEHQVNEKKKPSSFRSSAAKKALKEGTFGMRLLHLPVSEGTIVVSLMPLQIVNK